MVDMAEKNRFLEQIEQNQDIVHKICCLYAANRDDRKDLSQEIICQLWKSYQSFRGDSKFTTWMYKVALNTALLNLRRHRFRMRTESLKEHHANIPAEAGLLVILFIYGSQKIAQFFAVKQIRVYLTDLQNDVLEGSCRLEGTRKQKLVIFAVIFILLTITFIWGLIRAYST